MQHSTDAILSVNSVRLLITFYFVYILCIIYYKVLTLTVRLRQTIRLSWSQETQADFTPTQETSMERGNRKKTARPDSSRHRATDIVTYSFLQEIERRSQKLKQLLASKSVVLLCVHLVSSHAQLRQLIYKKSTQCRLTSCLV